MTLESASLRLYIIKRVLQSIPFCFAILAINFTLIHLAPGDPVYLLAGEVEITPEYYEHVRAEFGLNRPIYEQLFIYIRQIVSGNMGQSFAFRQSVTSLVISRIPATLLLMGASLVFSSSIGILIGVISSRRPYSWTDNLITMGSLIGYSVPVFWLGQILILVFALQLGFFSAGGMMSLRAELTGVNHMLDILHHLVLPALTLGLYHLALIARLTRVNMMEVLREDFIITARAKGQSETNVVYRHGLRNALLPVITVIGINLGFMFMGAVITETVFAWPGLGRLLLRAISLRDYPIIMGVFTIVSLMVIFANLITDIVYAYLDPRIRYR